jgi:hypothetical protein
MLNFYLIAAGRLIKKAELPIKATRPSLHSEISDLLRPAAFRPYFSIGLAFSISLF